MVKRREFWAVTLVCSLVTSLVVSVPVSVAPRAGVTKPRLRLNDRGEFKISLFADLHFGEEPSLDWGPAQDISTLNCLRTLLSLEEPDFVVLLGDQVTGEFIPNATKYIDMLVQPLVEKNTKFSSTFGNHADSGPNFARKDLLLAELQYDLSYSQLGPTTIHGVSNYWLPVYRHNASESGDDKPAFIMWFLDSNGNASTNSLDDKYIYSDQVSWFRHEHATITSKFSTCGTCDGKNIPYLVFTHVPTSEFQIVQNDVKSFIPPRCLGLKDEPYLSTQIKDEGFWPTVHEMKNVVSIYSGHDHGMDLKYSCCPTKDPNSTRSIQLCFARHTGYGGYGEWDRGTRVIVMSETDLWRRMTYVRMENGSIIHPIPPMFDKIVH
ncbi:Metallo-dependent phosphatase-like protein [Cladochytrium replicatum]|nr:Metallo-dependent phosphatase-like protein [Cladochytrium replicatum]